MSVKKAHCDRCVTIYGTETPLQPCLVVECSEQSIGSYNELSLCLKHLIPLFRELVDKTKEEGQ